MVNKTGGYIAVTNLDKAKIQEEFKGDSIDEEIMFPKGLGAKHPFDFESLEKLSKRNGLINSIVSKWADDIVTNFEVKVKNINAQTLINSFIRNTNAHQVIREWVKEGLLKGNGFIEIDLKNQRIRILNANSMYVRRNRKGKILEYNQWNKALKLFSREKLNETNNFKPYEIAHLLINKIPNEAYGYGIIYQNERIIENLVTNEQDLQVIISRKAGAPYHVKVGQPGANTPPAVVDQVKSNLEYLRNTVEWVTDGDTDIKSIDFRDLGKSLTETQMYFFRQLLAGVETPEVSMGSGQLNEGIARVQLEIQKRKTSSYQEQIGSIIEEKIIRPLLRANGFDEITEFVWDLPTEDDINKRIERIKELINLSVSPTMKSALEIELAKLLGFDDIIDYLVQPKDAEEEAERKRLEKQQEEEIPQPEVPGVKPNANEYTKQEIKEYIKKVGKEYCVFSHESNKNFGCYKTKEEAEKRLEQIKKFKKTEEPIIKESNDKDMTIKEWVNIKELFGFNYTDYLVQILEVLKNDNFPQLKGITESDIQKGLLTPEEIEKLRLVLKDGFRQNQTIKEIEKNINDKVKLRDRETETGAIVTATTRANNIARTETVRLANEGLLNLYNKNKIEKVRFLAALSDRTCAQCEALNGQVFNINESYGIIPVHTACRCSWISVIE